MADDLGTIDELLASLAHKQTLHRERAAARLGRWLRALPAEPEASDLTTLSTIEAGVLAACEAEAWEGRQGGFLGARKLLSERAPADAFVAGAVWNHGGLALDYNDHYAHHITWKGGRAKYCNYGMFFPFWDQLMGTRYNAAAPPASTAKPKEACNMYEKGY